MRLNKQHLWVLLGLILLNLALFSLNLNNFFLSDDFDWLTIAKNNEHSLLDYFSANYYGERGSGGSYRPMANVIFWLNCQIGGLNPLPYHLTNLLFHIGVCFLVYLLVLILFEKYEDPKKIAVLAAMLFSLLPNHSEAVIWISAVVDPVAAFFYLLAFYFYILFRQKEKFSFLLISLASFVLSLLTKEIAITLPLLILVWELYEAISRNKFAFKNIVFKPLGYWLFLILYFLIRYASIGLAFGYYARDTFKTDFNAILGMFMALIANLLFFGKIRVLALDYFLNNRLFFVFLLILVLALIWLSLKKYKLKAPFLFDAYFVLILPVLLLNFSKLSDEGERYNYLPSVIFCILLGLLLGQIKIKTWRNIISGVIIIYFLIFLLNKNYDWQLAANLIKKIILTDFPQAVDLNKSDEKLFFVALPNDLAGAQVLRNGIKEAIKLYYPNYNLQATVLNAYQRLDRKRLDYKVLYWGSYPTGGYIAESFDQKNWVTGFDRKETDEYIFELWNYDYPTYTSNTIRLILKDPDGNFIKAGEETENIIIFDQGKLKSLNK